MAHVPRLYHPGRIVPGPLSLEASAWRHLGNVLRMRAGEEFLVFGGDGSEWRARIEAVSGKASGSATVLELTRQEHLPALDVELYCALVRATHFDLVVEKSTELGVDVIHPMATEYTSRGDGPSPNRIERWKRIAVEASEQCGRLRVPVIAAATTMESFLDHTSAPFVVADAAGMAWAAGSKLLPDSGKLAVLVGPEGGWSEAELARARSSGGIVLRLGANILRTETAAIAALTLIRGRA